MKAFFSVMWISVLWTSCSFNFELTSQKTALENQVMGSYKELDDEVMTMASVRAVGADGKVKPKPPVSDPAKRAIQAKQNQEFNRDDLDELKQKQILGEAKDGRVVLLPEEVGLLKSASKEDLRLADILIQEENRDRKVLVERVVTNNDKLAEKDLSGAWSVLQKKWIEESPAGTWFQSPAGQWTRTARKADVQPQMK